jgi:hypothetical protein
MSYKGVECQSLEKDEDEYEITSQRILDNIDNLFFIMENADLLERCLDAAKVRGI